MSDLTTVQPTNLDKAKAFWTRNKTRILTGALVITTFGTVVAVRNQREFNAFLSEKELTDEFYTETDSNES